MVKADIRIYQGYQGDIKGVLNAPGKKLVPVKKYTPLEPP